MEDALRVRESSWISSKGDWVLILVLMEDALRVDAYDDMDYVTYVLILVLMEDALRAINGNNAVFFAIGLNPCSNGRCSARGAF